MVPGLGEDDSLLPRNRPAISRHEVREGLFSILVKQIKARREQWRRFTRFG